MKKNIFILCLSVVMLSTLSGCFAGKSAATPGRGGEVTGVGGGKSFREPTPFGMTLVKRGWLKMGLTDQDSLWGKTTPVKDISVDGFWMDETEVTNSKYKQFVEWVHDSILRTRLADPAYGGDETYMITEDKNGNPVTPHLNWNKRLPRKPNEDEQRAFESLYTTNPATGEKSLDVKQLNYRYEIYDYTAAALRRNRLNPAERNLNTDVEVNPNEVVMISKDTAYVDDEGNIHRETINRPLTGAWDFLNTYIVNVYPDTTCWVNDFRNSDNETYLRNYFSNATYNDYPVVGVTWEQANAFCAWRTEYLLENQDVKNGNGCFYANFKPDRGNYTKDGNLITSRAGIYSANSNGLYDMAGNVAEWTSTVYTEAGVKSMNDLNPQLEYKAAKEDPYKLKKKSVRGGSWKDPESYIRSAWRTWEYQNQPRSYIGFRCVRSLASSSSEAAKEAKKSSKKRKTK